ncbi:MAG: efflux RND transporter permease subunit, partial [Elusimicrobia bacterium]|nr:efflux RND transporter permease subunit [Elusimicrobiota bacterium]
MIRFFVRHPVTTIMFVMVFVVLGISSYLKLNIEEVPSVDFPIVTVSVQYPGATPLEVETLVIDKVEDAVSELSEIKKIRSESFDNFGYVFIEFLLSADVNVKSIEVKDKVEAILNDLPEDIEKPVIEKYDPLVTPVMELVLVSDTVSERDMYEFADKRFKQKLSSLEGVANIDIYGGKERQINVKADPLLMKQYYLTITDIVDAVAARNKNIPGGLLEKEGDSLSIRFVGEFADPQEIGDLEITTDDGRTIRVRDVASVTDGSKKVDSIARYNGQSAVGLSVMKVSDGNAIRIYQKFQKRFKEFQEFLPPGVDLKIAADNTTSIMEEVKGTQENIILGILCTILLLFLFTGNFRITLISAVIIPTSIISTFFLMDLSHFSINIVTLLSMATALGTLIANAIIIIENILVHLKKGEEPHNAAVIGTEEVLVAVLASTGTNLVVFTPIASMGGIVGQFFRPFGLTVIYATLFSLLASFTLTPMMCALVLGAQKGERKRSWFSRPFYWFVDATDRAVEFMKKEYGHVFRASFRYWKWTLILAVIVFFSMKVYIPYLGSDFMPKSDTDKIFLSAALPQGATIDRSLQVAKMLEEKVAQIPEVTSYLTRVGNNGVENIEITLNLIEAEKRRKTDMDIIDGLVPFLSRIPDLETRLSRGWDSDADVQINLYGKDYDEMIRLSGALKVLMEDTGYFRSVLSSYKKPKKEMRFVPDQEATNHYGLTASKIGGILRTAVYGDDTNTYKESGEDYKINVELADEYKRDFDDVGAIDIITHKGLFPITQFGALQDGTALPAIKHRDRNRVISVDGDLSKGSLGVAAAEINKRVKEKMTFPEGYGYRYTGDSEHQEESSA